MTEFQQRILSLRNEIKHHDLAYYVFAQPSITDREYDKLMKDLIDLEVEHPELLTADSPTMRVGGVPVPGLEHQKHGSPMLSLDNCFTPEDLDKFLDRMEKETGVKDLTYALEYKIDGCSISLTYENGTMSRALTRGDGEMGDNVTHNATTIRGISMWHDKLKQSEIRGEIFIGHKDFAALQAEQFAAGHQVSANSRNAASGALRLLDPLECFSRKLRFVAHGMGDMHRFAGVRSHYSEIMQQLLAFGIPYVPHAVANCDRAHIKQQLDLLCEKAKTIDLPIDGIVIKLESLELQKKLGTTSKSPRWAVAYKWERYEATTKVKGVTFQVGRSGIITPVAELEPVEIAETIVARSTLFNFEQVAKLDIRVGDFVVVEKAGKIIPHILRVDKTLRSADVGPPIMAPILCPTCGAETITDVEEVAIRCSNGSCPGVFQTWLKHYASRGAMDIDSLGDTMIERLYDFELVRSVQDLYNLKHRRDELTTIPGIGKKRADKLLAAIEGSKARPLANVLVGLGIRLVGETMSPAIAAACLTLDGVANRQASELAQIDGVGLAAAKYVSAFFMGNYGLSIVDDFGQMGFACMRPPEAPVQTGSSRPLAGCTVVVTGTLEHWDRHTIKDCIREYGGTVSESVGKKTAFVLVGENPGSKAAKAMELGITCLSEAEFVAKYGLQA